MLPYSVDFLVKGSCLLCRSLDLSGSSTVRLVSRVKKAKKFAKVSVLGKRECFKTFSYTELSWVLG